VLRPGGRFVASTVFETNMAEVWDLIGGAGQRELLSFSQANGGERLERHFAIVERRDLEADVVFPDAESLRDFVAATIDRAHLAPLVPELTEPLHATARHVIFVAEKAA
jgi:hypothetical protein